MLELAAVDLAHARAVQILAWKEGKVVRKTAIRPSVAVFCQSKLAQLILLPLAVFHLVDRCSLLEMALVVVSELFLLPPIVPLVLRIVRLSLLLELLASLKLLRRFVLLLRL